MNEGKGGFWSSLPGILTGAAALVSALAGAGFMLSQDNSGGSVRSLEEIDVAADNSAETLFNQADGLELETVNMAGIEGATEDPEPDQPVPAPPPTGEVAIRPIVVDNSCSKAINIWIAYEGLGGWTTSAGDSWTIAGEVATRPTYNGNLLNAKGGIAYFYARTEDGLSEWKGDAEVGGLKSLQSIAMEVDPYGDYRMQLTCN